MVFIGAGYDAAELVAGSPEMAFIVAAIFDLALLQNGQSHHGGRKPERSYTQPNWGDWRQDAHGLARGSWGNLDLQSPG